jgi:hypothetical protein
MKRPIVTISLAEVEYAQPQAQLDKTVWMRRMLKYLLQEK